MRKEYFTMIVYQGEELKSFIDESLNFTFKERFLLKDLHAYMTSENNRKTCCLYGLRRTGKTTMVMQEIRNLGDFENSLFVSFEKNDSIHQVKEVMKSYPGCRYLFLDEATKTEDFIDTAAFLADAYAIRGLKVVLSGTDSLGFLLAGNDELYDRIFFLHTTYIPYKEYRYLLDKGIRSYIRYGGTLTGSASFYNKERTNEYTNTAITQNIIHTLDRWGDGINYANQILQPVADSGELASFINKVVEYPTRQFLARIINEDFKSHDLGSLCQLMKMQDIADPAAIKTREMNERIRDYLGIKEKHSNTADDRCVEAIIRYLKDLDVLFQIPWAGEFDAKEENEYIFIQPGMRYSQASALARALTSSKEFRQYFDGEKELILQKLTENITGGILEDIVFYQLTKDLEDAAGEEEEDGPERVGYTVTKYRNQENREIDILVLDYEGSAVLALEVKLSREKADGQRKHLLNREFCAEIEEKAGIPIANKAVVYLGENGESGDGVLYINAEDFLTRAREMAQALLRYPQIESFRQLEDILLGDGEESEKEFFCRMPDTGEEER